MYKRKRINYRLIIVAGLLLTLAKAASLEEFHQLIREGYFEEVSQLMNEHPEWLNSRDALKLPPVSQAVLAGQKEIVALLIEQGADLEAGDNEGSTPLHNACADGQLEIVRLLIDSGAKINCRDNSGMTALLFAASRGHVEIADYLIQNNADPTTKSNNGWGPVMAAVVSGRLEIVQYLIDQGFGLNEKDHDENSILHIALFRRNPQIIKYLLDKSIDINAVNVRGATPLMNSIYRGDPELTKIILDAGADPEIPDELGFTPLMVSVQQANLKLLKLLIEYGARIDGIDPATGMNLLHKGAVRGQPEILKVLLDQNKLDVNLKDNYNMAPLDYVNKYGFKNSAEILIKAEAAGSHIKAEFGSSLELSRPIGKKSAWIWYLGHSGWALKIQNHLLIFDYWETDSKPDETFLRSGYITPKEIKDLNVLVFSSHEHQDHFIPDIFQWKDQCKNINYILGHRPEQFSGYEFMGPREQKIINGVDIKTIYSNDTGVGFLVNVDGLTLFHAGDHANRNRDLSGDYTPEIDYIADQTSQIDIAFLPNSGCNFGDNVAVWIGSYYTIEKLQPKVIFPMHNGEYFSSTYQEFKEEARQKGVSTPIICAMNRGDKFYYKKGKIQI